MNTLIVLIRGHYRVHGPVSGSVCILLLGWGGRGGGGSPLGLECSLVIFLV